MPAVNHPEVVIPNDPIIDSVLAKFGLSAGPPDAFIHYKPLERGRTIGKTYHDDEKSAERSRRRPERRTRKKCAKRHGRCCCVITHSPFSATGYFIPKTLYYNIHEDTSPRTTCAFRFLCTVLYGANFTEGLWAGIRRWDPVVNTIVMNCALWKAWNKGAFDLASVSAGTSGNLAAAETMDIQFVWQMPETGNVYSRWWCRSYLPEDPALHYSCKHDIDCEKIPGLIEDGRTFRHFALEGVALPSAELMSLRAEMYDMARMEGLWGEFWGLRNRHAGKVHYDYTENRGSEWQVEMEVHGYRWLFKCDDDREKFSPEEGFEHPEWSDEEDFDDSEEDPDMKEMSCMARFELVEDWRFGGDSLDGETLKMFRIRKEQEEEEARKEYEEEEEARYTENSERREEGGI